MAAELPSSPTKRKSRVRSGLCRDCSAPAEKSRCSACLEKNKRQSGTGSCRDCGAETSLNSRCDSCLGQLRAIYKARVLAGLCVSCKERAITGTFCLKHWFKNIGQSYGFNQKNGGLALLRQLWVEQDGKCAVTGEKLIPGFNAQLDHIVPVSRGGTSTKANLRWVTATINHMKWDLTHDEFVNMCRLVAVRVDQKSVKASVEKQLERSN